MALSRILMLLAVLGSLIAGAVMIVISFAGVLKGTWRTIAEGELNVEVMRTLAVDVIEVADALLLGVVMLLIALGLYQLFIDPMIDVPGWMRVASLSDLKENLVAVTIVLLGISFLSRVVHWNGENEIIYFGVAIAAVLVPLVAVFGLFSVTNREQRQLAKESLYRDAVNTSTFPSDSEGSGGLWPSFYSHCQHPHIAAGTRTSRTSATEPLS